MISKSTNVLFFDDEPHNLLSFKANFREHFNIHTTTDLKTARKILDEHEIHVVLSDQRMPQISGVEFLSQVQQTHPQAIRILITAYSDIDSIIDAINKGSVYYYIAKPWDKDALIKVIQSAYATYQKAQEKDLFIDRVSHDINGPLASIKGIIELIESENNLNQESFKTYSKQMKSSLDRAHDILHDLTTFQKVIAQPTKMVLFDFKAEIKLILESIMYIPNYQKNCIKVDVKQTETFMTQPNALKAIIQNLIHNAIRYGNYDPTHQPKVTIGVTCSPKQAVIEVKDNGIGIAKKHLASIFDMFYRVSSSVKGSGLGLYLVVQSLKEVGGDISVDSVENQGSCFRVTIPNADSKIVLMGKTVLLIDDDPINHLLISDILKNYTVKLITTKSGQAGLKILDTCTCDLILTDIEIPELDGFEICKQLRLGQVFSQFKAYQTIPVIGISSEFSKQKQQKAKFSGMNDYLPKPLDSELLMQKMSIAYLNSIKS